MSKGQTGLWLSREPVTAHIPDHELLRCIGRGSYGQVWLARNVMGTWRAVKIIHRTSFEDHRPFEREFRGIQRFEPISRTHDSQLDILHVGRDDVGGYFYYVMELADDAQAKPPPEPPLPGGESVPSSSPALTSVPGLEPSTYVPRTLKHDLKIQGRIPFADCLEIALSLTTALAHLHSHGLVHRDIKPSNIIFVNSIPKLADIGLVTDRDASVSFIGTEGYVPSEGSGTPSADLYSLGKVLYEISTGKDRSDFPEPPTLLGEFPDRENLLELNEIISRACARDPRRRFASAVAMHEALLLLQAGQSVRRFGKVQRRLALATRLTAIAAMLLALAGGGWAYAWRKTLQERTARQQVESSLQEAQLDRIRAARQTHGAGQRFGTLALLRAAAKATNSALLRSEAASCMALADLRLLRRMPIQYRNAPSFDADVRRYATNDSDGSIVIRSVDGDRFLCQLRGDGVVAGKVHLFNSDQSLNAKAIAFSADGRVLIVVRQDLRACLWPIDSQPAAPAPGHQAELPAAARPRVLRLPNGTTHVASTEDGQQLIAWSQAEHWMSFIDSISGATTHSLEGHDWIQGVGLSPSGDRMIVRRNNAVEVCETARGETIAVLPHPPVSPHPNSVMSASFIAQGRLLATGSLDHKVRIWDAKSGQLLHQLSGHEAEVAAISAAPTGNVLVSLGWDNTTRLWNMLSGEPLLVHERGGELLRISRSADRLVFADSLDRELRVMELAVGRECLQTPPLNGVYSTAFHPSGRTIVATSDQDGMHAFPLLDATPIPIPRSEEVRRVSIDPSGQWLFTLGKEGVQRWRWPEGAWAQMAPANGMLAAGAKSGFLRIDADGRRGAAWSDQLRIFELTGPPHVIIPAGAGSVCSPALGAHHPWLAGRGADGDARVWDARSGEALARLPSGPADYFAFSADDRWLVTSAFRGELGAKSHYRIWRTLDWSETASLPLETARDESMDRAPQYCIGPTFSRDNKMMAYINSVRSVRLVEPGTWRELVTLPATRFTTHLEFSVDSQLLAVASEKHGIQIWNLQQLRTELAELNLNW